MKLERITKITGTIRIVTGLHIGAGDTELRIGGTDNPVVKHPFTNEPYIPGSSLKGKMRSLLELESGLIAISGEGKPIGTGILKKLDGDSKAMERAINIMKLFGVSGADSQEGEAIGPARASFADAFLSEESRRMVRDRYLSYFEIKSENFIDRIKGTAEHPRFTERVAPGLIFDFSISFKKMDSDGDDLLALLLKGLKLVEYDALGGSGSRGYGRVLFQLDDPVLQDRYENLELFEGEEIA